ncbi:hypothetical protein CK203_049770 [Vitis vinifera]|uniref:Reverse transcriptase/retrotransposon-derived protein RNase H-like domain-containing protein n=1 Tax=Vitis vinifera TaxID=29760 RepID=A0A438H247_VITVI|nr:hypothetical protein CK203_049770 [Vitis vinifera]
MKNQSFEALKSFAISKIRNARRGSKEKSAMKHSDDSHFQPLLEHFLKSNLCMLYVVFEDQEVNNPMLQMVKDVEALITLRSGKKVEPPTPNPHVEEEEETKKGEEMKERRKRPVDYQRGLNVNKKAFLTEQQITPEEEEGLEEVCIIDTLVEEHCWRRREEILPLFNKEEGEAAKEETPKLNLKPLPEISLLEVLKRCKKAIEWQISDLKALALWFYTSTYIWRKKLKPIRQPQRRLNPHLQEVVRAEVLKLLQASIIYPISNSPWVSPTQVVPKKSGITVVQNEKGEEIATRLTSGVGEISGHSFLLFLERVLRVFQIEIDVERSGEDHFHMSRLEHTPTEECPLVYAMHLQHSKDVCLVSSVIWWSELWRFMDDITVYRGIVLGHIISEKGIEVDKAKVELIVKLPSPTLYKGLLAKDAKFVWDERCQNSFDQLKQFLTTAPIVRAPN